MSQQGRRGSEQVRGSLVDLTSRNILPDEIFHLTECDFGSKVGRAAKNNDDYQNVHETTIRWRHWVLAAVEEEREVLGAKGFRGTWIQAVGESKVGQHHCHCLLTQLQQYHRLLLLILLHTTIMIITINFITITIIILPILISRHRDEASAEFPHRPEGRQRLLA